MTRYAAAPLDSLARWATAGFWAITAAILAGGAAQLAAGGAPLWPGALLLGLGVAFVGLGAYYRRRQPAAYEIAETGVTAVPRAGAAQRFDGPTTVLAGARLGLRTFGSGGLYGYLGSFRLAGSASGPVKAFVGDRARLVVLQVAQARVAISPESPDDLRREVASWS